MNKALYLVAAVIAGVAGALSFHYSQPDFETLQGERLSWEELQGEWVVLNYFAEWCAPCLREVPELNTFHEQAKSQNIRLFAASFDALNKDELLRLKNQYKMDFSLIQTDPVPLMPVPKPQQLPATFLISPEGKVVKKLLGEQTSESLFNAIAIQRTR